MCPDPQSSSSGRSDGRPNAGTSNNTNEVDNDSGVSVSGNLSQSSDSASGSGSDGGEADNLRANMNNVQENKDDQNPPATNEDFLAVQCKAEKLAKVIIDHTLDTKTKASDKVEETMLRCVKIMTSKHEILFKGMMRRIRIDEETAYSAFITAANELFEGEKQVVDWGRIVALYAFGGQLALYCKEKDLTTCGERIPIYVGRYAKEVISPYVHRQGGWSKLCEEFPPEDDLDNTVWKFLTWTALGLGLLATSASFLGSR